MDFYDITLKEVFAAVDSNSKGLTAEEAKKRLSQYGYNELREKKKISPLAILVSQFYDPLVLILIVAAVISAFIGYFDFIKHGTPLVESFVDAGVIFVILLINAMLGFIQEYNAEKSIEALKKMAAFRSNVIRDGKHTEIASKELVPGDIILLSEGEKVPADCRLIETFELQTQEAALTGESLPIKKEVADYDKPMAIGDRKNMIFSGTAITSGRGKAVVVATGMNTEIGKIAELIEETEKEETPLQVQLDRLGRFLTIMILCVCALVFVAGIIRGGDLITMFIYAVGLAVAAVPEGLPAVVTISLSLGVKRMITRNALVRKLPSVETLGCTTVICSDKTGTLTHNEMTVKKIFVDNKVIDVGGSGYDPAGGFSERTKDLELLLRIGALNNDAKLKKDKGGYRIVGDPTEGALIVSAAKAGLDEELLKLRYERFDELPFDHKRKMMTTIHMVGDKQYAYVKGAPDMLLDKCRKIIVNEKAEELTDAKRKEIIGINDEFASSALRVLGFAYKELKTDNKGEWEENLVFVGLQGMIDPPRKEVQEAIAKCRTAGIRVIMITGDHKGTAIAIARDLGIEGKAVTGLELPSIDLDKEVMDIGIYARVNPEDKLRIVEAFQKRGHVVAMTGDGVNDAPALKKADLGIAMGRSGTDVAREASDMILTDDNFTTIVNAVEEGRTIYDNIRKFVVYLLSSNIGEIFIVFFALVLGLPLPIAVTQLLWVNLVTDGLPATALSIDPSEKEIMKQSPRKKNSNIIDRRAFLWLLFIGIVIMVATISTFCYGLMSRGWSLSEHMGLQSVINGEGRSPQPLLEGYSYATTLAFTTLVMLEMFNVLNVRNLKKSAFSGIFSNKYLWMAMASSITLQMVVIYSPLNQLFGAVPLSLMDWAIVTAAGSSVLILSEAAKLIVRMQKA